MASVEELLGRMRESGANVRFAELKRVCDWHFGEARVRGSHHIYKLPWSGDPRVNIQESKDGKAKPYQIRQVLKAIDKLLGS